VETRILNGDSTGIESQGWNEDINVPFVVTDIRIANGHLRIGEIPQEIPVRR